MFMLITFQYMCVLTFKKMVRRKILSVTVDILTIKYFVLIKKSYFLFFFIYLQKNSLIKKIVRWLILSQTNSLEVKASTLTEIKSMWCNQKYNQQSLKPFGLNFPRSILSLAWRQPSIQCLINSFIYLLELLYPGWGHSMGGYMLWLKIQRLKG